jgi:transcriptional regulator with XRE-family HTH domain
MAADTRPFYERELLQAETRETIIALLGDLGITQRELAKRLGVTEGRVSQLLRGPASPSLTTLADVGTAIGVRFAVVGIPFEETSPPQWLWLHRKGVCATAKAVMPVVT